MREALSTGKRAMLFVEHALIAQLKYRIPRAYGNWCCGKAACQWALLHNKMMAGASIPW